MSMVSVVRTTGRTFGPQMFLYTTDKRQLRIHKSQKKNIHKRAEMDQNA
jgi:hypothetical protein